MMKKIIFLIAGVFFTSVFCTGFTDRSYAVDMHEELSTDAFSFVSGSVSRISVEKSQVTIRPFKGKRIVVDVDSDTILEGLFYMDDLKKEQQVKVWYTSEKSRNRAVKIEKMMELGC